MAGTRTGTSTIVKLCGQITRLVGTYGAADMATRTSNEFATCVMGLVSCYNILRATDDFLLMVDFTAPLGPEDLTPP
jgi:hypothetical protein